MYKLIASGSTGNAILYNQSILVDCGVPFAKIKPYINSVNLLILTHIHADHLNLSTIKKMQLHRPGLRVACGSSLVEDLPGVRNIDIIEPGKWYNYGAFKIAGITLRHDVPNMGWRLNIDGYKIIHCTDSENLDGVEAKGYNLFALEHNYSEETVYDIIREKRERGEYAHQIGSINSHLSIQQAQDFIFRNKGENYEVLRLHESREL
jgi:phosphoribosyl 1,2-cyclic phosphodiesterase